jgi:hypothetical protein
MEMVCDPTTAEALDALDAGLDTLQAAGVVRHVANLSNAEASRRERCAKALRSLPAVRGAFAQGRIGSCQVERIARAHANPRVRSAVEANEASFAAEARSQAYRVFDRMVDE